MEPDPDPLRKVLMSRVPPFRFYGADPSEWEGDAYSYEVRFRAVPTEADRMAIARAFETALKGTDVDTRGAAIQWAVDWAYFSVERHDSDDFDYGLFFDDLSAAFEDVHRAVPIEEVVFIELIDGAPVGEETGGSWHQWSVETQPIPGDAPNWSGGSGGILESLFAARQTRFAAKPIVDPAAEAARREVWAEVARAAEASKLAAVADARVVFEVTEQGPTPPRFIAGSGREAWRGGPGSYCETRAPEGSWLYAHRVDGGLFELFLGDAKKLEPISPSLRGARIAWAYGPGSVHVWVDGTIHVVDLATRASRPVLPLDGDVTAMAVLDGALAVITGELTKQELVLFELGDTLRERLRIPAAGKVELDALLGGTVLVVHAGVVWGDQTLVLGYDDGRFVVLGASYERLGLVWEDEGLVHAELDGRYKTYVEIQNLADARRAALARTPESSVDLAASTSVYGDRPELAIEFVDV